MKTSHTLYSRLALITCITLVTGYAFVYAYTNLTLSDADSGKPLTATLMQTIMGNVNELNTRVSSLASGWGNLWGTGASNSINYTAGTVGIGSTAGTNAELQIKSGTKPHWGIYQDETTEELRFWNGSNRIVFGSGGNVGIGTASPGARLEVSGAANSYTAIFQSSLTSGQAYGPMIHAGTNLSDTSFTVNDATNTNPLFRVRGDGNVGIGTSSPNAKLQIESVTRTTPANQPLVLTSPTTAIGDKLGISFSQTDNYSRARAGIYAISELANGYASSLGFFTRNAEDGTQLADADEKMRITSGGNVSIGTTSTPGRLTVFANPQTIKPLYIQTIDDNNGATKNPLDWNYVPGIIIGNDWSGNAATVNSTKIAKIVLYTAAGGYNNGASIHVEGAGGYDQGQLIFSTGWNSSALATERMRINTLGYVGIWVPGPTYRLQLPNTASAAWQWQANAWVTYSDGRVKTNKETLKYGISEIMKMDPKQYIHHSSEFQSGSLVVTSEWMHTIGFIAQELEKIIPEAVNKPKDDSKELWSVDYNKIVPILVNAMKELKKENDSLKSRLDALEQR